MSVIRGEKLDFTQEAGDKVSLTVYGDEFYSRYENEEGYTVVYDTDKGMFCYADLHRGEFVSTGVSLTKVPPKGIRRHLRELGNVHGHKFKRRQELMLPSLPVLTSRTIGYDDGLLRGRKIHTGKVVGLTVIVEFQDVKSSLTKEGVSEMLNDESYRGNGNFCSVREYFLKMSGGKLDYSNEVFGPITLKGNRSDYIYSPQNLLVWEALRALHAQGVNFTRLDSTDDGRIDAINIMYAGMTEYSGWLWPHNSVINISLGGIRTEYYQVCSLGSASIGTFCHENGHMLCRFPDLYDYGNRDGDFQDSAGLGRYCLMSSGNHLDYGRTPSPVCAYLRGLAGWTTSEISLNQPGRYKAVQGDYTTLLKFSLDRGPKNEYFLVENRFAEGLDRYLPSSGLAVYHCDTEGSNEYQYGTPTRHYQCALLQADGRLELERDINAGDYGDLFGRIDGRALSYETYPSSRQWDRSDSGLIIGNISEPGEDIFFETKD